MGKRIFEEKGGPHRGHAAGTTDLEKQASQLASDVKYKVHKKMKETSGSRLNPAQVVAAYSAQLQRSKKSGTPPAVIALAKKKLMGANKPAAVRSEELNIDSIVSLMVEETVTSAARKVFAEAVEKKKWIVVKDKKTGNTYRRPLPPDPEKARQKIAELRANPNISSVEITDYHPGNEGDPQGQKTAAVKSGKGLEGRGKKLGEALDPVGKEDNDPDNDGVPISKDKNDQYIMKRRKAIGKAIATRKEEVIYEKKKGDEEEEQVKELKGKKNKVKVFPGALGEENDARELPTKLDLVKNRLRAKGIKVSGITPSPRNMETAELPPLGEAKMTSAEKEEEKELKGKYDKSGMKASMKKQYGKRGEEVYFATIRKKAMQNAGFEPEGDTISEEEYDRLKDKRLGSEMPEKPSGPVKVNATADAIEAIRKSIKVKGV